MKSSNDECHRENGSMSSLSFNRYFMSSQCADSRNLVVHSSLLSLEVSIVVLFQPTLLKEKIIVEEQRKPDSAAIRG